MKVALTIWGNRISPVFDSANTLMIVDLENLKISDRVYKGFDPHDLKQFSCILKNCKIDILICGAITDDRSIFIEQNGIVLIPFIFGNTDKILAILINEKHRISDFIMPGVILDEYSIKNNSFFVK
ncbi:MAG: dinitrogenase iron-molybdenum cofactor biosynthesis domain-containing protein [Desulfobacula sp.]|nr:dinitrogenase iron-molybdenum cofactor biosynthesis domain-containing protein [Desulfobacula sp.]MBT7261744.1 dinitrogenase iron-molybdenum cofactor biosynthesis domain-containing protein [Desulfobacula sp.]